MHCCQHSHFFLRIRLTSYDISAMINTTFVSVRYDATARRPLAPRAYRLEAGVMNVLPLF